jgi:DNA-binding CsgD family transcriptional regulator
MYSDSSLATFYRNVLTAALDTPEDFVTVVIREIRSLVKINGLLLVVEPDTPESAFGSRVETLEHLRVEHEELGETEMTSITGTIDKTEGKDILAEMVGKATTSLHRALFKKHGRDVELHTRWLTYDLHPRIALCIFRTEPPDEDFNEEDRLIIARMEPHLLTCIRTYSELTRVRRASFDFFAERCYEVASTIGLTLAEFRVLRMMVDGASNKEISQELGISLATVKTHISHILQKAGCRNRTGLIGRYFSSKTVVTP